VIDQFVSAMARLRDDGIISLQRVSNDFKESSKLDPFPMFLPNDGQTSLSVGG
jgi:hypothetical protein